MSCSQQGAPLQVSRVSSYAEHANLIRLVLSGGAIASFP